MTMLGEVGSTITIPAGFALDTTVTTVTLHIERPDLTSIQRTLTTASFVQGAGAIQYTWAAGDLTVTGVYRLQVVNATSGVNIGGTILEIYVGEALP